MKFQQCLKIIDRDQGRWISDKIFDSMDILYHAVYNLNRDFKLAMFFKGSQEIENQIEPKKDVII